MNYFPWRSQYVHWKEFARASYGLAVFVSSESDFPGDWKALGVSESRSGEERGDLTKQHVQTDTNNI